MAGTPPRQLSRSCSADPIYLRTVVNTLIFLAIGVNLHLFGALLLSGFFMRRNWRVRIAAAGLHPALGGSGDPNLHRHPLDAEWRMGVPQQSALRPVRHQRPILAELSLARAGLGDLRLYLEMDAVLDGDLPRRTHGDPAGTLRSRRHGRRHGLRRFVHVTFPLLANLYLICTLLSTIWTLGDFNTVYFVTGGGPALSTHVLATLGIRDAFEVDNPQLGMAAVMSALPLLIPLVIILMRKLAKTQVQL